MDTTSPTVPVPRDSRALDLELLALDLSSCTRCVGSLANIETAIDVVRKVLEVTGTSVSVRRVVVESEQEARQHRFVSSPTIRISGHDIALDTVESRCESCTDLCGCTEGTSCRVWTYRGVEHTEAPVGLIVEALLRELTALQPGVAAVAETPSYELPANLRSFFAAKASRSASPAGSCCSTSEQATCCEAADKVSCCGDPEAVTCNCR
jgi:hypothetical protein